MSWSPLSCEQLRIMNIWFVFFVTTFCIYSLRSPVYCILLLSVGENTVRFHCDVLGMQETRFRIAFEIHVWSLSWSNFVLGFLNSCYLRISNKVLKDVKQDFPFASELFCPLIPFNYALQYHMCSLAPVGLPFLVG